MGYPHDKENFPLESRTSVQAQKVSPRRNFRIFDLHNEEIHNLYFSPNTYNQNDQVKEHELGRHVARMEEKRNAYRMLLGKSEGKRSLGRSRRRWVDNIKKDHREIGWGGMDLIIWLRTGNSGGVL
jgi:hypothetical protein